MSILEEFITCVPKIKKGPLCKESYFVKNNSDFIQENMIDLPQNYKNFFSSYLDIKRISPGKSNENNYKKWGFSFVAFCPETHEIKLKNDTVVKLSEDLMIDKKEYLDEKEFGSIYFHALNLSYYHFQIYVNPEVDNKIKKIYTNRLNSFLKGHDFKKSWSKNYDDIYKFSEDYIIVMEINILLFLTRLTVDQLFTNVFKAPVKPYKI